MGRIILRLRPADAVTVIFLSFLLTTTVIFNQRIPMAFLLIGIYSSLIFAQILLIAVKNKGRFVGHVYDLIFPMICILVVFDSMEWLVRHVNPRDIDPLLIRLDYMIFKGYPTVMLEKIMSPLLTDIFQIAYTTYYFLPIILGVILKFEGKDEEFNRSLFLIVFCFYLSYLGYILMPALGPRYTMHHLQTSELESFLVAEPIQSLLNNLEGIKRDAFPSGHTGIALLVLGLAYRFQKKLFWLFLPVVIALVFSTVYCRYHYVVDVIGGVGLTVLTLFFGEKYYGFWAERNNISR